MKFYNYPIDGVPEIERAGRYTIGPTQYLIPGAIRNMAIHQHEYPGKLQLGTISIDLSPGDVTITPPEVLYSYRLPRAGEHLCIIFDGPKIREKRIHLPLHLRLGGASSFVREKLNHTISMFRLSHQSGITGDLFRRIAAMALQELLLWLVLQRDERTSAARHWKTQAKLEKLTEHIDSHLGSILSVPELAALLGLSQDYLAQIFRKRYGVTIPRYILSRRMDTARHLLLTTQDSVGTIGGRVGLSDPQYFNKQFRRLIGMSPSQFRHRLTFRPS